MDIYSFTKRFDGFEHETFFHFRWNEDHYDAHVFLYNRLHLFEMMQVNGNWEFIDEDSVPVIVFGAHRHLSEACTNHYQWMKALLKK